MSLVSQIASFVSRVATEFNSLRSEVTSALAGKADSVHGHAISDVTNLQTTLDGKASTSHGHAISDVTDLQNQLNAKADLSGASFTGLVVGKPNTGGTLVNSNDTGNFSVRNATTNDAASMSFHRPGQWAVNMGIDTDNGFKIGGWSLGTTPRYIINSNGTHTFNGTATFNDRCFLPGGAEIKVIGKDNITTRTEGGYYETSTATTAEGWPQNAGWYHLISSTHSNTGNYYALQIAANFFNSNDIFNRSTNGNGNTAWSRIYNSSNIHSTIVSPTSAGSSGVRKTTISTSNPSGGADGDVWLKYS